MAAAGPHDTATLRRRKPSKELVGFRAESRRAVNALEEARNRLITAGGGPQCIGHLGANVRFGSKADVDEPVEIVRLVPQADFVVQNGQKK